MLRLKHLSALALAIGMICNTASAENILESINGGLKAANDVLAGKKPVATQAPAAPGSRVRNLAAITPEQQEKINQALQPKGLKEAKAKANLAEASENLNAFLQINGCIKDYDGSALNLYAAPGYQFARMNYLAPMTGLKYHDRNSCLSVVRLQSINAPALNALKFEVVYVADDSGESVKSLHTMVKQPDGQWLFQ